jgi:Trypsin-co-occurring domain 1
MIFDMVNPTDPNETPVPTAGLPESVVVQVVPVQDGRAIAWSDGITEKLRDRVDDIREAVVAGVSAIAVDTADLPAGGGWQVSSLSASFGITLAAEAGVVLSKASAEATFEVTVTFTRK